MGFLLAEAATATTTAATTGATQSATAEAVLFWVFAVIAVGAGIAVVSMRNIVHAALMLVVNFLSIAALYLGLQSSFLSIVQVIVYAGAIVVLFLFVIMLLGVRRDDLLGTASGLRSLGAVLVGVLLAGALLAVVGADTLTTASACGAQATDGGAGAVQCAGLDGAGDSVRFVASSLFTRWTFVFELSALLLVVATLGALVLGRRKDPVIEDDPLDDPALRDAARQLGEEDDVVREDDAPAEEPATAGVGAGAGDGGESASTDPVSWDRLEARLGEPLAAPVDDRHRDGGA
jgi:NADH-quinone oxidoreductase subunit J